jgi:hypothetical protein
MLVADQDGVIYESYVKVDIMPGVSIEKAAARVFKMVCEEPKNEYRFTFNGVEFRVKSQS